MHVWAAPIGALAAAAGMVAAAIIAHANPHPTPLPDGWRAPFLLTGQATKLEPAVTVTTWVRPETAPAPARIELASLPYVSVFSPSNEDAKRDMRPASPMAAPDAYLWAVYQRQAVKKDGAGDFTWKDPAAAKRLGKSVPDYAIGGMHRDLREGLFKLGKTLDGAGYCWTILSGFRDNYRQRIASGFKAGECGSYHGGSCRTGGWRDGRAVDIWPIGDGCRPGFWAAVDKALGPLRLARPMRGIDPGHIQVAAGFESAGSKLRAARAGPGADALLAQFEPVKAKAAPGKVKRYAKRYKGKRHHYNRAHGRRQYARI